MSKAPADGVRNSIIEECLTDRCPRCRKAFVDFDGCFAVKCANCPCGFCGWCFSDCGNDAHEHARNCRAKVATHTSARVRSLRGRDGIGSASLWWLISTSWMLVLVRRH